MRCKNCGSEIQDGSKYCNICGAKTLVLRCPKCNAEYHEGSRFCPECGANLKDSSEMKPADQVSESKATTWGLTIICILGLVLFALFVTHPDFFMKTNIPNGSKGSATTTAKSISTTAKPNSASSGSNYYGSSSSTSYSDRSTDAKICAEKLIRDQLKAPSTASFCKYSEMKATNISGDKWRITGWVDSQNSFGAMVRNNWEVTLTLTATGFKDYSFKFN